MWQLWLKAISSLKNQENHCRFYSLSKWLCVVFDIVVWGVGVSQTLLREMKGPCLLLFRQLCLTAQSLDLVKDSFWVTLMPYLNVSCLGCWEKEETWCQGSNEEPQACKVGLTLAFFFLHYLCLCFKRTLINTQYFRSNPQNTLRPLLFCLCHSHQIGNALNERLSIW